MVGDASVATAQGRSVCAASTSKTFLHLSGRRRALCMGSMSTNGPLQNEAE